MTTAYAVTVEFPASPLLLTETFTVTDWEAVVRLKELAKSGGFRVVAYKSVLTRRPDEVVREVNRIKLEVERGKAA